MGEKLIIKRVFDAPRERVWKAWTDPEEAKKWWGPIGFTAPHISIDLRVGGKYLNCMRGAVTPGGKEQDFWSGGVYREITPPEKIVVTDYFTDEKGNKVPASYYGMGGDWPAELKVTAIFEDQEGKTKFTLRHAGLPSEHIEGARQGWSTSFDKLARLVSGESEQAESLEEQKERVGARAFAPKSEEP